MTRSGVWILLVSLATPAAAQEVGSFSGLAQLVEAGDDVRVTLRGGRSLNAQVAGVTPDTLSVVDRGIRRDLGEADVWAVDRRLEDSNANGAWLGFAAGAAYGVYTVFAIWESPPSDPRRCGQGPDGARRALRRRRRLGGYAVDRMIRREEAVYRPASRPRLSVAPVLSPDRRGVAVSLGF